MKATEQYFPVVLFITFYKVVLSSESAYEILKSDYLKMSHNSCLYRCLFLFVSFCFVFFYFWSSVHSEVKNLTIKETV